MSADALASFEAKWSLARPELPLALRFEPASTRPVISAFACLSNEIAHAAFHIAEPEVATTKLHWWAEELSGLTAGKTRHPLTRVLIDFAPMREMPVSAWTSIINGALAQRDARSSSTLSDLLEAYRRFEAPVAEIQARLYPRFDVDASVQAAALSRAFHETIGMIELLARDRLPLPLDLLARHQLARGDLTQPSAQRTEALRDHFSVLEKGFVAINQGGLSALGAISLRADQRRSRCAAKSSDPLAESARNLDRLPFSSAWTGWRAARRMQASA